MKKSAIALAVAAALGMSAVSQAETTLYGSARVSVDYLWSQEALDNSRKSWEVTNNSSRLGVRGSEDLGNGLSAIYQYEFGIDVTGDTNYFNSNRPRLVGLKGNFGQISLGTQYTPYYNVLGVQDIFNSSRTFGYFLSGSDLLGGETGFIRGIGEVRDGNSVYYATPNFYGFTGDAFIVMDGDNDGDPNSIDRWEGSLKYENGPFYVGAVYAQQEGDDDQGGTFTAGADDEQYALVLGYLRDTWSVTGSWQRYDPDDTVTAEVEISGTEANFTQKSRDDVDAFTLQGSYAFGNNSIYATYSYTDPDDDDFDEIHLGELGIQHQFSKRTRFWVEGLYGRQEVDARVVDLDSGASRNIDDIDAAAISVGIRHDF